MLRVSMHGFLHEMMLVSSRPFHGIARLCKQGNKEAALDLYEFYLADDRVRELAHRFLSEEEMARWQRWYRSDRLRSSVPLAAITCTFMVLFGVGGICLYGMEGNALLYSLLSGWAVGALVEYLFFRLL